MGRILSIDYGMKRIGLALSDPMKIIASPLKTLQAGKNAQETLDLLLKEIASHDIETIVIGLPLHLSNEESEISLLVRKLKEDLETKISTPIILWDERLTSKQVERLMIEGDVKRKKRSQHVDTLSATLILQSYMDSL
ncbi:Holliday junction resolvase RuvX [Simkania negevensis]|uniref:Putative pre-16S rRNA nuclease n=1 Tax=Simkania negevensis (strain ATCC VR-1471 / DSM 27360 / Z) TaxID=331113 RepID=F8L7T4_SIMNZ|nr:Holliday junction resolvase RuvX [Simkania negevensis]MCB1067828.1 Holliday junction resolvase RuvX [Simkania sp.]MCB1075760.1 Holliday junction resolvase RuvX [Simkania sp.]MCP5490246.1 Holliday junction resolvase RuvX [Chlamydiales bacterium]CCB88833.1 putative Holliday junction resolvase [Simkania negevensis Z]